MEDEISLFIIRRLTTSFSDCALETQLVGLSVSAQPADCRAIAAGFTADPLVFVQEIGPGIRQVFIRYELSLGCMGEDALFL